MKSVEVSGSLSSISPSSLCRSLGGLVEACAAVVATRPIKMPVDSESKFFMIK